MSDLSPTTTVIDHVSALNAAHPQKGIHIIYSHDDGSAGVDQVSEVITHTGRVMLVVADGDPVTLSTVSALRVHAIDHPHAPLVLAMDGELWDVANTMVIEGALVISCRIEQSLTVGN